MFKLILSPYPQNPLIPLAYTKQKIKRPTRSSGSRGFDTLGLVNDDERIDAGYLIFRVGPVRPSDLESIHLSSTPQTKMKAQIGLRKLAPAAGNVAPHADPIDGARYHRAHRIARALA